MTRAYQSSGDVLADRRAGYAKTLSEDGDHAAAADLMAQAMDLVPDWTAGWDLYGRYAEQAGHLAQAISAWRRLEALDDDGLFAAGLKLAAHGAASASAGTATSYVEALFDQYAPQFESSLVGKLGYRVPQQLDAMLGEIMLAQGIERFETALDLGCGTGLMGEQIRPRVGFLEGIDLSAAMIAETARKGIYDRLGKAEMLVALLGRPPEIDLVTAADVFIYSGALPPVLAAIVAALRPGGLLAFSLETHDGLEPVFLRPSLRYAHGVAAARLALADAGFDVLALDAVTLRQDRGLPVAGVLVVAQKTAVNAALTVAGEMDGEIFKG